MEQDESSLPGRKRAVANEVHNEFDLTKDGQKRDHQRDQQIKDEANKAFILIIRATPYALLVIIVLLIGHYGWTNNWQPIENGVSYVISAMFGGLIAKLKDSTDRNN
jgi:hypothetical protein